MANHVNDIHIYSNYRTSHTTFLTLFWICAPHRTPGSNYVVSGWIQNTLTTCISYFTTSWTFPNAITLLQKSAKRRPWEKYPSQLVDQFRVPTAQGKQGKWPKKIPVNTGNFEILSKHRENTGKTQGILSKHRKNREFCLNTGKTQGTLLAQVVNVLILKVKDIVIVANK